MELAKSSWVGETAHLHRSDYGTGARKIRWFFSSANNNLGPHFFPLGRQRFMLKAAR